MTVVIDNARPCRECGKPFPPNGKRTKKFCSDRCKDRHNIQKFINAVRRYSFTVSEAAIRVGRSESTIRKRIRRRGVDTFKLGQRTLIRRSAVRLLA